jgi:cyclohexa-1,5-dienecarbonyl-CoA hydratase
VTFDMQPVQIAFNADQTRAAITLFDPKGNIVTEDMVGALRAALEAIATNPHLKLITLEGHGRDFSFGASIPEHAPEHIGRVLPAMHALILDLLDAPAATAAIVRGRCLGGGFELALACDFIFAAGDAQIGLPEVRLGVFPPAAAALLPRRVGAARAAGAIITGASRPAGEWHEAGLIEFVSAPDSLTGDVDAWFARCLAPLSASGIRHAAAAARHTLLGEVRTALPALEAQYLEEVMNTTDAIEGVEAFLARRPPRWSDR